MMQMVSLAQAKKDMRNLLKSVVGYGDPVMMASKEGTGVLISLDEWAGVCETLNIKSNKKLANKLKAAMTEPLENCVKEIDL